MWLGLVACGAGALAEAGDWPTYRGDNARSGATTENLQPPFAVQWAFDSQARPISAWGAGERERVIEGKLLGLRDQYDDAFHVAVVGDQAYFGSMVDHHLRCVDLKSGKSVWSFATGGPIRLAPSVDFGRVYFGSDDGRVYCVDAATGKQVWSLRAGPEEDWLLARGEMVSRWPIRTGVLVDDGVAYFGAGIFPHEDVFVYAVDAATGEVVWKQDNISTQDAGRDDLSPQGYLLASDEQLFVPSGRSLPAAFDRQTGQLQHKRSFSWRTTAGGIIGGTRALLADGQLYTSGPHHFLAIEQESGKEGFGWFAGRQLVVRGDEAYALTGDSVARLDRGAYAVNSRRRHDLEMEVYNLSRQLSGKSGDEAEAIRKQITAANDELKENAEVGIVWRTATTDDAAVLVAGDLVFVGGPGRVVAYSAADGHEVWRGEVNGQASGLVVASGHLLVSTDSGNVYCLAPVRGESPAAPKVAQAGRPADVDAGDPTVQVVDQLLQETGVRRGFGLVVGLEDGRLVETLARRSELTLYCVDPDAEKVERVRERMRAAGLYGHRVIVHQFEFDAIPYANYFANLITSEQREIGGTTGVDPAVIARHLKPVGGVFALAGTAGGTTGDASAATEALQKSGLEDQSSLRTAAGWALLERGALPGAGSWSHQYGNPANTAISDDVRVRGGLGVLWYGDPGPGDMVNRHDGAVGPLSVNGRLFVQGDTTIKAYDAYNGLHLWTYENPDALRTGVFQNQNPGNLAASDNRLFHFVKDECIELDAASGEVVRKHRLPAAEDNGENEWGYVAVQDGLLFGTATRRPELAARDRRRGRQTDDATDSIFAINIESGKHLWNYQGNSITHHTIAIGPDRVCFIDSSITSEERSEILRQDKGALVDLEGEERAIAEERLKNADVRTAVALDARTGEKLWGHSVDVTDCSEIGIGGGKLTMMYQNGVLILGGANANGHYWKQFVAGEFERRRLVALSAEDGYKLWAKDANYRHRPIVIGEQVLAEPWIFDLHTGVQQTRPHPLTGEEVPWSMMRTGHHCGMLTGCDSGMLMFRSGFTGFYDLEADAGVQHFGGHRLGCWINAIPANGLVLIPEASAGCVCLFSIASTVVLEPREPRHEWTIYSTVGAQTPVRHMALNLGAPGDRKADDGTVWFSYPRRTAYQETSLDLKLDLKPQFVSGGGFRSVSETTIGDESHEMSWTHSSWAQGLKQITLPLLGEGDAPAEYIVRLTLADLRPNAGEPSRFDVVVDGTTLAADVSVPGSGGDAASHVVELPAVKVERELVLDFVAKSGVPIVNAIEVRRLPE
ncbi:MAG: PQQ-binding-like beta-propeller repeat protein [Planctomycetaceae bacterium]|nr:PQQ-binding-like beta-propeller repeat protein [Planctomycetaceae bacterium]